MTGSPSRISVVVPVFGDGSLLRELVDRAERPLRETLGVDWELLLVNDGSPMATWEEIARLAERYPNVVGINLLRNFGQHNALLAGILQSSGDVVVTLDDDLQQPPEAIPLLVESLRDADVVYGRPTNRPRGMVREFAGITIRLALASVLGVGHARQIAPLRAFRGTLRSAFRNYRSPYVSIDVLLAWATARIVAIPVKYDFRRRGGSGYTLRRLLSLAATMVMGFSVWPLRLASILGLFCAAFGGLVLGLVLFRYFRSGVTVPGFPFLASVIAIFSGTQLFALGIMGEYLARMYFRMMDRPAFIIDTIVAGRSEVVRP
jgi:undecaprenyl-phosphate 4-deoxy-4-formamido-L-arabinose transferase